VLFVPPPVNEILPMPTFAPIPCVVCEAATALATFDGTLQLSQVGHLQVFDSSSHRTMAFEVPPKFRGVDSSDGVIKGGTLAVALPGLLARVTYRTVARGHNQLTHVLLLTRAQCAALQSAERINHTPIDCPD
jgi:hypothetical protein